MEPAGAWAEHVKPAEGAIEWTIVPRRARVAMVDGRIFATIRRDANGWTVSIPGFSWPASDAARRFGATRSVVKVCKTIVEAQRVVVLAYQSR